MLFELDLVKKSCSSAGGVIHNRTSPQPVSHTPHTVNPCCPAGGAHPPGSQVLPLHASGRRDPQADPGEEGQGEGVGLLRAERPLRLSADFTGGVFGQSKQSSGSEMNKKRLNNRINKRIIWMSDN